MALLTAELLLRPLSGKREDGSGSEQRWYTEGIAHSHFSPEGLRLTGSPALADAGNVLILGDSHVAAVQVSDRETMGAVLERALRAVGGRYNALQYGWEGAGGADYVFEAKLVKQKFHPAGIALIVTAGDFRRTITERARLFESNGQVYAAPLARESTPGRPVSYGGRSARLLKQSALLYAGALRWTLDIMPRLRGAPVAAARSPRNSAEVEETVRMIVRGLKAAYEDPLLVVYAPAQPWSSQDAPEPEEAALLAECRKLAVRCTSLRKRMLDALRERQALARGFANSKPGFGHLNAIGHELAADAIREWLSDRP